ncbi:MAG: hypothetical protein JSV78_10720 [Phycisphaerales bacterium]|nr:MAG: hypothetical protein JSV78_10720 [Phycisphaerales bacterium]
MIEPPAAIQDSLVPAPRPCGGLTRAAVVLVVIGAALSLIALFGEANRERFGFAYLWGFTFLWSLALGALFFVGLQHLTHAVWSVVVRRVGELFAGSIALVAILFIPILVFCLLFEHFPLYPWLDHAHVEHDHLLQGKQPYLNLPFFVVRAVVFFIAWIAFAAFFVGRSLRQDAGEGGVQSTLRMRKVSAPFMIVFGLTATFAGIDWLMSLEPHWFSTIFGVYVFSGMVVASLALITIATLWLRSAGRLGEGVLGSGHLYNLGALLFGFVCFRAYIGFSQYMLIWYGNLPEESFYMVHRLEGGWLPVTGLLALLGFVVPFLALLSRSAKVSPRRLVWVSVVLLISQLLDLYWLIMPQVHEEAPVLGWQELGPPLLLIGVLILYVSRFLGKHHAIAVGDPLLAESQGYYA